MSVETASRFFRMRSPVGELLLAGEVNDEGLALHGIYFSDAIYASGALAPGAREDASPFADLIAELGEYFEGERRTFDVALTPRGTAFQREVWRALEAIPYGTTTTYAAIARSIGRPRAVRAVGAANGHNPLSIVVPCHRVIGHDGSLTGYAGGVANKRALLDLEARTASR